MRALVTGATGFLGTWISNELGKLGHKVVRLVRDRTFVESGILNRAFGMTDAFGDVLDLEFIERVIAEYEINTVFHLAAQSQVSTGQADPTGTLDINIRGTWNVLEASRRQKVGRVIVASSDKSYGEAPDLPYTESHALRGGSPYETSKACADLLAQSYASTYGMSIAITRCANLYGGGHLNWSTLIPGTIKRLWDGIPPVVYGGGEMTREFLYIEDAVSAYLTLAESREVGAFNFGGGEPTKVIDIVRMLIDIMATRVQPDIRQGQRIEIRDQSLSSLKAHSVLDWSPKWSMADGLKETVRWYVEWLVGQGNRIVV